MRAVNGRSARTRGLGRGSFVRSVTALAVGATLLVAAGCSNSSTNTASDPTQPGKNQVRLYGTDGNMSNSFGAIFKDDPGALNGMVGTTPLTRLPESFKQKLLAIDPKLADFNYAGETYDAVVISALAAQVAESTRPADIAKQINGVTAGGTTCQSPAECLQLIKDGKDVAYRGASLQVGGFTDVGEPAAGTYGTLRFGDDNKIDSGKIEYVPAGNVDATTTKTPPKPVRHMNGPLKLGELLPHTGQLGIHGPPMFAGARLALDEINAAGGVLGRPVQWISGDSGTNPDVAKATVHRLIEDGADVIIGAGASSITAAVLPEVVSAGVVLFSPTSTSATLTSVDDHGLFFRTAPPDGLQAKAVSDIILRDGVRKVFIVARDDAYGNGLADGVAQTLVQAGVSASDVRTVTYNTEHPDFTDLGDQVKSFQPGGVLVIGFEESADAIKAIEKAGLTTLS